MEQMRISVIIACVNGLPSIDECLTALDKERSGYDVEIIVLNCCHDGTVEHVTRKFPSVRLLHFTRRLGIPELRAIGMDLATGAIVSIIEDHCLVQPGWFGEILKAHGKGYQAVGGTVVNGSVERVIDWAVFFCEYSAVMPPVPYGRVPGITGNNASYRKELLDKADDRVKRTCWEFFLHEELRKSGVTFFSAPSIMVSHKKEFGLLYFIAQRYYYSRSFAGMRREQAKIPQRALYVACSPLLPALMLWRTTKQVLHKKRHLGRFVQSLPLLLIFMISYAAGEFVGYLLGGGDSLLQVE